MFSFTIQKEQKLKHENKLKYKLVNFNNSF